MLSFKFTLTSAQLEILLDVYAGFTHPSTKVTDDNFVKNPYAHGQFVNIVGRLIERGYVVRIERKTKKGELRMPGLLYDCTMGYVCTQRGRAIAQMAIESAQKMLRLARIAEKRGLDVSSREEGVA